MAAFGEQAICCLVDSKRTLPETDEVGRGDVKASFGGALAASLQLLAA
jgi:hypothetical protein